jgi:hypothetical protein
MHNGKKLSVLARRRLDKFLFSYTSQFAGGKGSEIWGKNAVVNSVSGNCA